MAARVGSLKVETVMMPSADGVVTAVLAALPVGGAVTTWPASTTIGAASPGARACDLFFAEVSRGATGPAYRADASAGGAAADASNADGRVAGAGSVASAASDAPAAVLCPPGAATPVATRSPLDRTAAVAVAGADMSGAAGTMRAAAAPPVADADSTARSRLVTAMLPMRASTPVLPVAVEPDAAAPRCAGAAEMAAATAAAAASAFGVMPWCEAARTSGTPPAAECAGRGAGSAFPSPLPSALSSE